MVRGRQLIPANPLHRLAVEHVAGRVLLTGRRIRLHDVKRRARRVRDHRNPPDCNIHGPHVNRSTIGFDRSRRPVDIGGV